MTGKQKRANIGKSPKNTKTKKVPIQVQPIQREFFPNRSEFALVAVGKGLAAQSVKY